MSRLERGMTRQQVVAILGPPDAVRGNGPCEQLEYTNRLISWSGDRTDFNVILKDGQLYDELDESDKVDESKDGCGGVCWWNYVLKKSRARRRNKVR
jgi:hypothetical protein